jgi:hypothetical protein
MSGRTPIRNRLARPLPAPWRSWLVEQGVPKRKYTAVCAATLAGGRRVDPVIIEEGWIIATDLSVLADAFEQRIDFDPGEIASLEIRQVV